MRLEDEKGGEREGHDRAHGEEGKGGAKTALVAADAADARKAGIEGTPALFVNGRLIDGAAPYEQVAALIEDELKRQAGK